MIFSSAVRPGYLFDLVQDGRVSISSTSIKQPGPPPVLMALLSAAVESRRDGSGDNIILSARIAAIYAAIRKN